LKLYDEGPPAVNEETDTTTEQVKKSYKLSASPFKPSLILDTQS
jgi:hypothetical protein